MKHILASDLIMFLNENVYKKTKKMKKKFKGIERAEKKTK